MAVIYSSKKISYSIIFFLNFLTGIEYAVILPTALQYLQKYHGGQLELGLCLSAYSFSSLFSSPLMGRWSDKTNNTKLIMLLANLWQIAGNIMYFMGQSTSFIICGRLVAGVGLGVISCTFSDVIKTTSISERSPILSKIMIGRQIGMIIGPGFNFLLINVSVYIGPYLLNNLSAPGFIMASAWILLEILVIFFYKNLNEFTQTAQVTDSLEPSETDPLLDSRPPCPENTPCASNFDNTNADNSIDEEIDSIMSHGRINSDESNQQSISFYRSLFGRKQTTHTRPKALPYQSIRVVDNSETVPLVVKVYDEYIREEVVVVYATTFMVFFMQTCLETFLTPFTQDYFGWTDLENSILYGVAGFEIMLVFALLSMLSKRISDRAILLVGLVGNTLTLIFLIVYLPHACPGDKTWLSYLLFAIPTFGNIFSLPFIVLASISLLSKITSPESQGLTQGIRRTVVGLACILGPNWSGSFYKQWYLLLGPLIGLLGLSLTMSLLSYKYLKPRELSIRN